MTLAKDIPKPGGGGIPLLRSGVAITPGFLAALRTEGVRTIWIDDEMSEGIVPVEPISDETRSKAERAVSLALGEVRKAMGGQLHLSEGAVHQLSDVALLIAKEVQEMPDVALHLADMMGADQYLLQHVIDVTALGTVLARQTFSDIGWVDHAGRRRFDHVDPRLSKIALGLLLHDIGKLSIPHEVLNKPGKLDAAEWALVKRHPTLGVEMLGDHVSFLVKAVVRSHHERFEGGGYPDGIAGDQIHQFARIAAVADVYDAVTSERSYKHAAPPHVGVRIIEEGSGTHFDPECVAVFRRVVMPYPPGSTVLLADGRVGVVADVSVDSPYRPLVRVRRDDGSIDEVERAVLAEDTVEGARAAA